jgi:non-heme Fe2+,alpha-ketoglutarate-dependent halogenase
LQAPENPHKILSQLVAARKNEKHLFIVVNSAMRGTDEGRGRLGEASMKTLTERQVQDYRQNGFLFPIPVLSPAEVGECMTNLERVEARLGAPLSQAEKRWRLGAYTYLPWLDSLIRHPRILDVIEDILGPDILVFTATFFIKEPGTPAFTAWHQDATYFGLHPHDHVTAWVAFTDASAQAGCMDVIVPNGSHKQLHHAAAGLKNSINGAGQVIIDPLLDETNIVTMELRAGEMSLHNTLCPHRSAPNAASHRRIGFGISYIPAHVRPTGSHRMPALLVRGADRGNFDLLPSPAAEFAPEAVALNERNHKRFYENYAEQLKLHDQEFARRKTAAATLHA